MSFKSFTLLFLITFNLMGCCGCDSFLHLNSIDNKNISFYASKEEKFITYYKSPFELTAEKIKFSEVEKIGFTGKEIPYININGDKQEIKMGVGLIIRLKNKEEINFVLSSKTDIDKIKDRLSKMKFSLELAKI